MGLELAKAFITVSSDASQLGPGLNQVQSQTTSAFKGIASAANAAFAAVGAGVGLRSMIVAIKESIGLAERQIQAEQRVAAAVRATGGSAGFTADELKKQASALQAATTIGDEEILELQASMLSFRAVSGDIFTEAIESSLDLAEILGGSAKSSALQLGKALEDPAKRVTELGRAGVTFSQQQIDQIKVMQETGRLQEAQLLVMEGIKIQSQGLARAMAETPVGKMRQAANILGDTKERLGTAFIPIITAWTEIKNKMAEVFTVGASGIAEMIESIFDLNKRLGGIPVKITMITFAVIGMTSAVSAAIAAWKLLGLTMTRVLIGTGVGILLLAIGAAVLAVIELVKWIKNLEPVQKAIERNAFKFRRAWELFKQTVEGVFAGIMTGLNAMLAAFLPLEDLPTTIGGVFAVMLDGLAEFVIDAAEWFSVLIRNWKLVWRLIKTVFRASIMIMQDVWGNFTKNLPILMANAWNIISKAFNTFVFFFKRGFDRMLSIASTAAGAIAAAIRKAFTGGSSSSIAGVVNRAKTTLDKTVEKQESDLKETFGSDDKKTFDLFALSPETKAELNKAKGIMTKLAGLKMEIEQRRRDQLPGGGEGEPGGGGAGGAGGAAGAGAIAAAVVAERAKLGRMAFPEFSKSLQDALLKPEDSQKEILKVNQMQFKKLEDIDANLNRFPAQPLAQLG